jgi:hypothetical protein
LESLIKESIKVALYVSLQAVFDHVARRGIDGRLLVSGSFLLDLGRLRLFPLVSRPSPHDVTAVGSLLDLTGDPPPIGLQRVVPLHQLLETKALCRIAQLLSAEAMEGAFQILSGNQRLQLLHAQKVLFVQSPHTIDLNL